jgi:hypothetical protein
MSAFIWTAAISALISFVVPVIFVAMRQSVKAQRQEVVRDLQTIFALPDKIAKDDFIPSFEFLKYKYFLQRGDKTQTDARTPKDFTGLQWAIGIFPLAVTAACFNTYCSALILHYGLNVALSGLDASFSKVSSSLPLLGLTIMASYAGAALFTAKAFFRAIRNFDLSPHSFVGAWVNLVFGVGSAIVLVFGVMRLSKGVVQWGDASVRLQSIVLLTAFVVGRLPDLTNRNLLRAAQLRNYKREDVTVYKSFTATPIEIIDGIDGDIRERLADFHINAVQNLAAANPLMLFVETPYGVYQIMDWVAQAQLCCSAGPKALLQLWSLGIRTIFDLERAVLDPDCRDPHLAALIGRILVPELGKDVDEGTIVRAVRVRLDNPHVHRLRQIFIKVADRIGPDYRHLPPLLKCACRDQADCFFHQKASTGSEAPERAAAA